MAVSASSQRVAVGGVEEKAAIAATAFIADAVAQARVSADLFGMTLGKANIRDGSIDTALAISDWPRDLDLLIVDLADSADPVADAAALKTTVPGGCVVIGVGGINDVALYRDLMAVGFNDYLALPLGEGVVARAAERAFDLRERRSQGRQAPYAVRHRSARRPRCNDGCHHRGRNAGHPPQGRGAAGRLRSALWLADAGARPRSN
jgi:pilus assembly protein CpaE